MSDSMMRIVLLATLAGSVGLTWWQAVAGAGSSSQAVEGRPWLSGAHLVAVAGAVAGTGR